MERKIKSSTALAIGGIALAGAFVVIAILNPGSLDRILHPGDERSDRIKEEMERRKGSEPDGRSDDRLKQEEKAKGVATTPTPSPEETARAGEGDVRGYEQIPKPECISRDQVVKIIGASEEAREGRVIGISVTPDGGRIMVAYRKKTFFGIGSGENQIEGILRRGLRNSFPDRLIKSVKVRSAGNRSVRRGVQDVKAEVLEIETLQAGCRWP
ncbi:MAG TPA: hypothetical protein VE715_11445 [Blastocatellia bacterium]|nr:hypothetical protein [Blastocatellia bacterium]